MEPCIGKRERKMSNRFGVNGRSVSRPNFCHECGAKLVSEPPVIPASDDAPTDYVEGERAAENATRTRKFEGGRLWLWDGDGWISGPIVADDDMHILVSDDENDALNSVLSGLVSKQERRETMQSGCLGDVTASMGDNDTYLTPDGKRLTRDELIASLLPVDNVPSPEETPVEPTCPPLVWENNQGDGQRIAYCLSRKDFGWYHLVFYNGSDWEILNSNLLAGYAGDRTSSDPEILKDICQEIENKAFADNLKKSKPKPSFIFSQCGLVPSSCDNCSLASQNRYRRLVKGGNVGIRACKWADQSKTQTRDNYVG
jgi:hypothetical protein